MLFLTFLAGKLIYNICKFTPCGRYVGVTFIDGGFALYNSKNLELEISHFPEKAIDSVKKLKIINKKN